MTITFIMDCIHFSTFIQNSETKLPWCVFGLKVCRLFHSYYFFFLFSSSSFSSSTSCLICKTPTQERCVRILPNCPTLVGGMTGISRPINEKGACRISCVGERKKNWIFTCDNHESVWKNEITIFHTHKYKVKIFLKKTTSAIHILQLSTGKWFLLYFSHLGKQFLLLLLFSFRNARFSADHLFSRRFAKRYTHAIAYNIRLYYTSYTLPLLMPMCPAWIFKKTVNKYTLTVQL